MILPENATRAKLEFLAGQGWDATVSGYVGEHFAFGRVTRQPDAVTALAGAAADMQADARRILSAASLAEAEFAPHFAS